MNRELAKLHLEQNCLFDYLAGWLILEHGFERENAAAVTSDAIDEFIDGNPLPLPFPSNNKAFTRIFEAIVETDRVAVSLCRSLMVSSAQANGWDGNEKTLEDFVPADFLERTLQHTQNRTVGYSLGSID